MKFSTINAGQASVAGGFCFVVRKVRVKAAQKLNGGRNRKRWVFCSPRFGIRPVESLSLRTTKEKTFQKKRKLRRLMLLLIGQGVGSLCGILRCTLTNTDNFKTELFHILPGVFCILP